MLRTSEERFFKLFLWYFLKIFSFYNKIMYWQAHISHSHPNLDFFALLNFCFLSSFVISIFFFSLLICSTWFLTLLAFISLDIYSNIYFSLCFSFDIIQFFLCFFLNLFFFQLVLFTGVFVSCSF